MQQLSLKVDQVDDRQVDVLLPAIPAKIGHSLFLLTYLITYVPR